MAFVSRINGSKLNTACYYAMNEAEFVYNLKKVKHSVMYFTCSRRDCPASGMCDVMPAGGHQDPSVVGSNFRIGSRMHNHFGDLTSVPNLVLSNSCKLRAVSEPTGLRQIYDEEKARNSLSNVTFVGIENAMYKARRRTMPAVPASVEQLVDLVRMDERYTTTNAGARMLLDVQELGVDGVNMVLVSPTLVAAAAESRELHIDGTFKVVPRMFQQLLTIHIVAFNHSFPVVFALMQRRTTVSYIAVLRVCRDRLGLAPDTVITDYEIGLVQAVQTVFPAARVTGCLFHFAQAIWRKVQALGMVGALRLDDGLDSAVKMAMALPFLPARDVEAGVVAVQERAAGAAAEFPAFLRYLRRFWLVAVGPAVLSVYGQPRRTNNCVESFHRVLSRAIPPHPNPLSFLDALRKLEASQASDFVLATAGRPIRRRRKPAYLSNNTRIRDAMREFGNGAINVSEYLRVCSHAIHGRVVVGGEEELEEHQNVEEYQPLVGMLPDIGGAIDAPVAVADRGPAPAPAAPNSAPVPAHAVQSSARTPAERPAPGLVADADTNVSGRNPPVVIVSVGSAADVAGPSGTAGRPNPTRSSGASYADSDDSGDSDEDFVTNSLQIDLQVEPQEISEGDDCPGTHCLICRVARVGAFIQPCGHIVACYPCMQTNQLYRNTCPYCKVEITSISEALVRGAE